MVSFKGEKGKEGDLFTAYSWRALGELEDQQVWVLYSSKGSEAKGPDAMSKRVPETFWHFNLMLPLSQKFQGSMNGGINVKRSEKTRQQDLGGQTIGPDERTKQDL